MSEVSVLQRRIKELEDEIDDLANGPCRDEYEIAQRLRALLKGRIEEDDGE